MDASYLGKTVRIQVKDGRSFFGILSSFTHKLDIILADSVEQQPANKNIRQVGQVVIPGPDLVSVGLQRL